MSAEAPAPQPQGPEVPVQAPAEDIVVTTPLLTGPRETGVVPLGNGAVAVHEITRDGMKQTRQVGSPWKTAAHFHAAGGVASEGELAKVAAMDADAAPARGRVIESQPAQPVSKARAGLWGKTIARLTNRR